MGATNTTANYSLSQFISTDKPAWLQDYNGDMLKIDTGINGAKVAADNAANAASAAQGDATSALGSITTINTTLGTLSGTVNTAVGNINTINSLIGNGTPTTTDQTIIGAINEINADLGDTKSDVSGLQTVLAVHVYTITPETGYTFDGVNLKGNTLSVLGRFRVLVSTAPGSDTFVQIGSADFTPANSVPIMLFNATTNDVRDGYIDTDGTIHVYLKTTDSGQYLRAIISDFI